MSGSGGNAYVFDQAAVEETIEGAFDDEDLDYERKKFHHARRKVAPHRIHRAISYRKRRISF